MIPSELFGIIGTTFIFGLTSSLHCVTMCGPLIMTVKSTNQGQSSSPALYQIGRLLSYVLLGVVLGWMGKGANAIGSLGNIQGLSAILSFALLCLVGIGLVLRGKNLKFLPSFSKILTPIFSFLKRRNQMWALAFTLGLVSAFLPCGVLYPAYAVAFATGDIFSGGLVMAGFFFGTFPALFGFSIGIDWIQKNIQAKYVTFFGILLIAVSLGLLVLRVTHTIHSENCDHSSAM
jgi:sulfite exporter TauE/SafE